MLVPFIFFQFNCFKWDESAAAFKVMAMAVQRILPIALACWQGSVFVPAPCCCFIVSVMGGGGNIGSIIIWCSNIQKLILIIPVGCEIVFIPMNILVKQLQTSYTLKFTLHPSSCLGQWLWCHSKLKKKKGKNGFSLFLYVCMALSLVLYVFCEVGSCCYPRFIDEKTGKYTVIQLIICRVRFNFTCLTLSLSLFFTDSWSFNWNINPVDFDFTQ